MAEELPELLVSDAEAWAAWLEDNHGRAPGVWLVLAKKGTTEPTQLDYERALEEALCFGWIDGQVGRRDENTYRQRFTPRRPASRWSKNNVARVERLLAAGRMRAPGLDAIERAKADGRWESAYEGQARMAVPDDLMGALAGDPRALANFELLSSQNRYAVLYRIHDAKRPQTRAKRIEQFVGMLARGETIHPQRRPPSG